MYTLKDLSSKRDENGRIILDQYYGKVPTKVELTGKREKEWWILEDCNILVKFTSTDTFEDYAELLAEETYRYFGIGAAHYDLISLNGRKGVISVDVREEEDVMISGRRILKNYENIVTENNGGVKIDEINAYYNTLVDIKKALYYYGFQQITIDSLMRELDQVFAISCLLVDSDKHWENWSVISRKNGSKYSICPQYDSAGICRFKLKIHNIEKHLRTLNRTKKTHFERKVIQDHIFPDDFKRNSILRYDRSKDELTGMQLLEVAYNAEPDRFGPIIGKISEFDPAQVIKKVEERINAELPDTCKYWYYAICLINILQAQEMLENMHDRNKWKGEEI